MKPRTAARQARKQPAKRPAARRSRALKRPQLSVYDRMCWPTPQLEHALCNGQHRRELAAFLGEGEYAMLRSLARAAARVRCNPTCPKVYLLPGIMGSQLGYRRAHLPPDLLWIDPSDIIRGRLSELRAGSEPALEPLGVIDYSYLPLKLRLQAAGFEVVLYDYDWRADLRALGGALAERLRADPAPRIALVGHSMGGLLARAALSACTGETTAGRVKRVIGLGTPHGGSIAAVQALRATYPVVLRLGALDRRHTPDQLSRRVFGTFVSLYQMLPSFGLGLDLLDPGAWPRQGARPRAAQLAAARGLAVRLALADARFASIIGTGQRTATGLERRGQQFRYQITSAGDGTVATFRATLPGARNYYLRCEHSDLPRSERVAAAIADLLRTGRTRRLQQRAPSDRARPVYVSDAALAHSLPARIDWQRLHMDERRHFFADLSAPPSLYWPAGR